MLLAHTFCLTGVALVQVVYMRSFKILVMALPLVYPWLGLDTGSICAISDSVWLPLFSVQSPPGEVSPVWRDPPLLEVIVP